jgi:hypothetical protein
MKPHMSLNSSRPSASDHQSRQKNSRSGAYLAGSAIHHLIGTLSITLGVLRVVVITAGIIFIRKHESYLMDLAEKAHPRSVRSNESREHCDATDPVRPLLAPSRGTRPTSGQPGSEVSLRSYLTTVQPQGTVRLPE